MMSHSSHSKQLSKILSDLQRSIDNALYERACLRHLLTLNGNKLFKEQIEKEDVGNEDENSAQSIESIQNEIKKLTIERDYLLKELVSLTEENDDIYSTLNKLIDEKESIRSEMDKAKEELDSCKQLIDFLVLERDEMKKEIDTKDKLLDCYNQLFNKENMFHFREATKKKK